MRRAWHIRPSAQWPTATSGIVSGVGRIDQRPFARVVRLPNDAYLNEEAVFHIVARAFPHTTPFVDSLANEVWGAILGLDRNDGIVPRAACLMPDHVHLILSPGAIDLRQALASFKAYTTTLARGHGVRPLWQPSYFDRRLRDDTEVQNAIRYLLHNPVQANLVEHAEDWPFTKTW